MGQYQSKVRNMIVNTFHRNRDDRNTSRNQANAGKNIFPDLVNMDDHIYENLNSVRAQAKKFEKAAELSGQSSMCRAANNGAEEDDDGFRYRRPLKKNPNDLIIALRRRNRNVDQSGEVSSFDTKRRRDVIRLTAGKYRWQVDRFSEEDIEILQQFLRHGLVSCLMAVGKVDKLHFPPVIKGWSSCPDIPNAVGLTKPQCLTKSCLKESSSSSLDESEEDTSSVEEATKSFCGSDEEIVRDPGLDASYIPKALEEKKVHWQDE